MIPVSPLVFYLFSGLDFSFSRCARLRFPMSGVREGGLVVIQ